MASFRKKGSVWYFRFMDVNGVRRERKGCPDRRATEDMARAAESDAAMRRAGMIDPKAESMRGHEARPLAAHLDDFEAALAARGSTAKHVRLFADRARRVAALVGRARLDEIDPPRRSTVARRAAANAAMRKTLESGRLSDLTPSRIQSTLSALIRSGRALATANHHRAAIKAFCSWAVDDGRMREDPTGAVTGYNAKEDRRHDRRTISLDDLRRLIGAAESGPSYRKMTGPARALCYSLAVATGLRYSEIKSITPASIDLAAHPVTISVPARYTKNGDPATFALPADVASDLARFVASVPPGSPVFNLPDKGPDMLRIDLDAAGIPYRDAGGLVFDFHALRCQCATLADAAGISPRVVQRLMRHSTLELTGRYTRPRTLDIEGAAASLPSLRPDAPTRETAAATGTHGSHMGNRFSPHLPLGGDGMGRMLADDGDGTKNETRATLGHNPLVGSGFGGPGRDLAEPVVSSGDGTRTHDLRIMRPPL
jgi:integrase